MAFFKKHGSTSSRSGFSPLLALVTFLFAFGMFLGAKNQAHSHRSATAFKSLHPGLLLHICSYLVAEDAQRRLYAPSPEAHPQLTGGFHFILPYRIKTGELYLSVNVRESAPCTGPPYTLGDCPLSRACYSLLRPDPPPPEAKGPLKVRYA